MPFNVGGKIWNGSMANTHSTYKSIITRGLHLHLDASSPDSYPGTGTTWYDLSGQERHQALTVGSNGGWKPEGYFHFDNGSSGSGTNHNNAAKSLFNIKTYNATMSFWALNTSTMSVNAGDLASSDRDDANGHRISWANSGRIDWNTDSQSNSCTSTYNLSENTWYNIVCTIDTSIKHIYINGVRNSSKASSGQAMWYDRNANFGSLHGLSAGYSFKGYIASIIYYTTALTAAEVLHNFTVERNRFGI